MAKLKKTMKEQQEKKDLNKEEKRVKRFFFEKSQILQVSRVSMPFKIWSSSTLWHMILWSMKTIKIGLKLVFPVCGINCRIQNLICPLIDHRFIIHHNISLKPFPCQFSHCILHQPLMIHFFLSMICCFQSSSRHAIQAGISEPKIISLYLMMVPLMASSSSFFVFVQFWRGMFSFFASFNSDVLFIY